MGLLHALENIFRYISLIAKAEAKLIFKKFFFLIKLKTQLAFEVNKRECYMFDHPIAQVSI